MRAMTHLHTRWRDIPLRIAGDASGIAALLLGDERSTMAELQSRFPDCQFHEGHTDGFDLAMHRLEHEDGEFPPLAACGTGFQKSVWAALCDIPCGQMRNYSELARAIGRPNAARAVAAACAANPIAILIPCHRVIRSDGSISGYRWGVEIKRKLLDWERGLNPCA